MSRIGKLPIPVPANVKVDVKGDVVRVTSSDGKKVLERKIDLVKVKVEGSTVKVEPADESRDANARHGLYRTLISNMVTGIKDGWEKTLLIEGAGYKAELKGQNLVLTVGYSKPKDFPIPKGLDVTLPNATTIVIKGADKELVGQTAAALRAVRKPDPYRGKGIRYKDERAIRKAPKGK